MGEQAVVQQAQVNDVRVEVLVEASVEKAFAVFTQRCQEWWPKSYRLGPAERTGVKFEPRLGGRWYQAAADGKETLWGKVLAWEPPGRLVVSWQISPQFTPEPDAKKASQVDVRFVADGPSRTRVTVVHSEIQRHGEGWAALREGLASETSWPGIMKAYAALAASAK